MILPVLLLMAFQAPMLENEAVQVHMAVDQPHSKSALHKHDRDRVMIYLNDGHMRIANQGGKVAVCISARTSTVPCCGLSRLNSSRQG
jgi:hypothetical protein